MRSDLALDPDFQILEVTQKPHSPIFISNLYNGKDANNIYTISRLKQIPVPQQQMVIYTGDWNLHHANWSLDGTTRGQATQHKNWLDNTNLTLINTPGVPTWQSKSGQQLIIDLTFANAPASNNSIIKDWQVNHELSFTSDHFPITWTIDQGQ
jgi:endonuclease/exonuclease/phosphatase family metal-dependent hydrolase